MQIKDILTVARDNKSAIGAFNILNYITARAVIEAANECQAPVIIQTSVSTVKSLGIEELGGMLRQLKDIAKIPIIVHLDHCRNQELAKQCLEGNWDSVMIDGSHLPMNENIKFTKEIADYAHKLGKQVEGELGVISGVEDDINNREEVGVTLEDCELYVKKTGIDVFAPALGTAHGVYHGIPQLRFDLVEKLNVVCDIPIVVHGGSGLPKEDFQKLIVCGASKINISTALKQSYLKGMQDYCNVLNPLEADRNIMKAVHQVAKEHISIFQMKA